MKWLVIIDMDGTLLEKRTLDVLVKEFGLSEKLYEIEQDEDLQEFQISEKIASIFHGIKASDMERIFDEIPLVQGVYEFVRFLKTRIFITAILTDSYTFLASRLAKRLGIDEVRGNTLEISQGIVTGRIRMPLGWEKGERCRRKAVCKLHEMLELANRYKITRDRILAIGDTKNDICMIQNASLGIAIRPKDPEIIEVSTFVASDFLEVTNFLKSFLERAA